MCYWYRAKTALQVPGDAHQIIHPAPDAVPDPIFGNTRNARAMVDRHFLCSGAIGMDEDGQEAVQSIEGRQAFDGFTLKDPHSTSSVLKVSP